MQLVINGETQEVEKGQSVQGLITFLKLDPRKIAIERNLEIVPPSQFAATQLAEGDRIEIVGFIGGG